MRSRRRRISAAIALPLGIIGAGLRLWPAESFAFAGLSPRTTIEAVRLRYRHSLIAGRHVYVAEADSHDHIYGIGLAQDGESSRRITIFFERRGRQRNEYPPCEQVAAAVRKHYGEPTVVQEFSEERSKNRRLTWRRGAEDLSLLCFRMGRQPLFASELTITADR